MSEQIAIESALMRQVEQAAAAQGKSVEEFVSTILAQALESAEGDFVREARVERFEQRTHDFGGHIESPWTLLSDLESEDYIRNYRK